ncbi:DUF6220 domain-containing protein [Actinomycetes bacterium KLBMP 9797]
MRMVYVVLTRLVGVSVFLQFFFAAVGAFDRPREDGSFALHSLNGMVILPLLIVLATIAAAAARAPGRLIGLTLAPLGLVVVQVLIIVAGNVASGGAENDTGPVGLTIFGLHAVNGLVTMGVIETVSRRARAFAKASREIPVPA